jgi:hypothetical protein
MWDMTTRKWHPPRLEPCLECLGKASGYDRLRGDSAACPCAYVMFAERTTTIGVPLSFSPSQCSKETPRNG